MTSWPALDVLTLRRTAADAFIAANVANAETSVVFGGQLIGQTLVAACVDEPSKVARQVHTVFSRAGDTAVDLEFSVQRLHSGRTLGSSYVMASQSGRVVCASLVLHDSVEEDVLRAAIVAPDVPGPADLPVDRSHHTAGAQVRPVEGAGIDEISASGPAELAVWVRWNELTTADQTVHQALLAWFTDPFVIPAAMRPHPHLSLSMAHRSLSTGVLSHTLTFHEPIDATQWMLIRQSAVHGGSGRVYGEGHVFTTDGTLVASFVQEAMIRATRPGRRLAASSAL